MCSSVLIKEFWVFCFHRSKFKCGCHLNAITLMSAVCAIDHKIYIYFYDSYTSHSHFWFHPIADSGIHIIFQCQTVLSHITICLIFFFCKLSNRYCNGKWIVPEKSLGSYSNKLNLMHFVI